MNKAKDLKNCTRCGTCCKGGGPALHVGDLPAIHQGAISLEDLYTIRAGELIRNNIEGGLFCLETEMVKIADAPDSSGCRLYDLSGVGCTIYERRPAECRAMKCWDTSEIIDLYARNRICRKDLFGHISWLWDLIETHEAACRYADIRTLAHKRSTGDQKAGEALLKMISYDGSIRKVLVEKSEIGSGLLDLLFGRPLSTTLPNQFGIPVITT